MRTIFPNAGDASPARKSLRQALILSILLVVVWAGMALMPSTPPVPPQDSVVLAAEARDNGTEGASQTFAADERSLIGPGYIFVLVLLGVGGLLAFRVRKAHPAVSGPGRLREIGRLRTGQSQQIQLVSCAGEVLLIGSSANGVNLLKAYPASEFAQTPVEPAPAAQEAHIVSPETHGAPQDEDLEWTVASAAAINNGPDFLTLLRRYANRKTYKANTIPPPSAGTN